MAIYFVIYWSFIFEVAILEPYKERQILRRSYSLIKGYWWLLFGILLFSLIPEIIYSLIFGFMDTHWTSDVIDYLYSPLIIIVYTLLYFHLRVRKEQYNLEKLREEFSVLETMANE